MYSINNHAIQLKVFKNSTQTAQEKQPLKDNLPSIPLRVLGKDVAF